MDTTRRISLVIPAFNEAAVIARAIREADDALGRRFAGYEILVVDDGSTDATASVARAAADSLSARTSGGPGSSGWGRPNVRVISHDTNRGYGAALRTGFTAATGDLVAFTDADCQFDLADLGVLAPLTDRVPVVVGYRANRQDPWRRKFLSRGYNRLARTLLGTGVRDVDCALKVFRRDAVLRLLPASRGFFVNTEMLTRARQLGLAVAEVPVTHRPRAGGASKVSLAEVPRTFRVLVGFWWAAVVVPWVRGRAGRAVAPPAVIGARVGRPGPAPRLSSPVRFGEGVRAAE